MQTWRWLALCTLVLAGNAPADERIGAEILVDSSSQSVSVPRVVSHGLGATIVWSRLRNDTTSASLQAAHIDGAGTLSGPTLLTPLGGVGSDVQLATDGRTVLAAWIETHDGLSRVLMMRLTDTGVPLDTPLVVATKRVTFVTPFRRVRVAYDGAFFRLVWEQRSNSGRRKLYTQRVGLDGTLFGRAKRVKARKMWREPLEVTIGCRGGGQCLVTWLGLGLRVEGLRMNGDAFLDTTAIRLLDGARDVEIRSNGSDYMLLGHRTDFPNCTDGQCPRQAVAARFTADGLAPDVAGIVVNAPPPAGLEMVTASGLTFDGSDYVAVFTHATTCGRNVYGAKIRTDGTVLNADSPGSLVSEGGTSGATSIAATATGSVIVWQDERPDPCGAPFVATAVFAQQAFAHTNTFGGEVVEIGSIGPLAVSEQSVLRRRLTAPGLNPSSTSFTATNLPPGAAFDDASGALQWKPNPNDAGSYAVHLSATDGNQTVSEDVSITVADSGLALCGNVERLAMPEPGVAVELVGGPSRRRVANSGPNGEFCFFYVVQGNYLIRVGRPSRKLYEGTPISVVVANADVQNVRFIVRRIS